MRKRFWPALLAAFVLAGCGSGTYGGGGSTSTTAPATEAPSTSVATTPPLDAIVPPDTDGNFPDDLLVSCGAGSFPIGAIDTLRPLDEADPGGLTEAISPFLESEEGAFWPQNGWQVLHLTEDEALLVAHDETGGLAFMSAEHDGSGWSWAGANGGVEECHLQFVVPEGLNTVDWRLDPDGPPVAADTEELAVILTERECVGGIEIGNRLVEPQIVMTETQVFMAFASHPPEGDAFDCQSNPDTRYVVSLPEPIGERELVEGLDTGIVLDDYVG